VRQVGSLTIMLFYWSVNQERLGTNGLKCFHKLLHFWHCSQWFMCVLWTLQAYMVFVSCHDVSKGLIAEMLINEVCPGYLCVKVQSLPELWNNSEIQNVWVNGPCLNLYLCSPFTQLSQGASASEFVTVYPYWFCVGWPIYLLF